MPIGVSQAPYHKLEEGKEFGGEIVDFKVQQKIKYESAGNGGPMFFGTDAAGKRIRTSEEFGADGSANPPICDWVFTVETGEADENGDTERRIFIDPRRGAKNTDVEGRRGRDAIERALKQARAHRTGLEIGGKIFITRGPDVVPKKGELKCATYTARYEPPAGGVGTGGTVSDIQWMTTGKPYDPAATRGAGQPVTVPPISASPAAPVVPTDEPPF